MIGEIIRPSVILLGVGILDTLALKDVKLNHTMSDFYRQDQFAERVRRSFLSGAEMLGHRAAGAGRRDPVR